VPAARPADHRAFSLHDHDDDDDELRGLAASTTARRSTSIDSSPQTRRSGISHPHPPHHHQLALLTVSSVGSAKSMKSPPLVVLKLTAGSEAASLTSLGDGCRPSLTAARAAAQAISFRR